MTGSPFPGMDPYIERHWPDVHTAMVASMRGELNRVLPEGLVARTEERIAIEADSGEVSALAPDVRVTEVVEPDAAFGGLAGTAVAAPYRLVTTVEPLTQRYVEVIDTAVNRLVTVIEFLSPSNKRGKGLEAFRDKRALLLAGGVHVVEIDLVRLGDWEELLRPHLCPRAAVATYRVTTRLATDLKAVYLYPIGLRDRLPRLPIPLRPQDAPVEVDLQALLDTAYREGRYRSTLDYARPCEPPLVDEDARWASELLRSAKG